MVLSHSTDIIDDEICPTSTSNSGPYTSSAPSSNSRADANTSSCTSNSLDPVLSGMGLPIEIWLYVIDFLARDVVSLLACALTCRLFRYPAQSLIDRLRERTIDANGYDDLNNLAEEILHSPKHRAGTVIRSLTVSGKRNDSNPVVLSVIPIRLSRMLFSLHKLTFENFAVSTQPHPSRWSLYGRVFPNVTNLELGFIKFPTFKDFVVFVTSFRALATLRLAYPDLGRADFCPGILQNFNKQKFSVQDLTLQDRCDSSFLAIFVQWLIWRDAEVRALSIAQCVPSKPGQQLLRHFRESIQDLKIHYMATPGSVFEAYGMYKTGERQLYQPSNIVADSYLAEPFRIDYPALTSIAVYAINERDIPGFTSILPYIVPSLQTLSLWVSPRSKDFDDFAWQCLDAIISSWFMVKHTHYKTKLALRYMTWPGDKGRLVKTLFPLATSLGEGSWCSATN
ncbi:hypothetical protein NLI96_g3433 [Meripilus lineatus]|uniref:F-box domain-containing protein n=1 Tax=Meripilus lineatus TaxID=2056292 RepID=A0AAD5V6W5_9APHY|nr:hypothetical protein NLI96_g3433 [Physisporinus lineatus]